MSKTIIVTRTLSICAVLLIGVTSASASEVTGSLSSGLNGNTSNPSSETSGTLNSSVESNTIGGTVTESNSNSGGSGGGGGSRNNQNEPTGTGQVLGVSTTNSPSFPNAGFNPGDGDDEEDYDVWETLMVLASVGGLMTFAAARYQKRRTS